MLAFFFFFNDPATTEISTLSLHAALPICQDLAEDRRVADALVAVLEKVPGAADVAVDVEPPLPNLRIALDRAAAARYGINASDVAQLISTGVDRKSTRLNSSHLVISYAVF